MKIEFKKEKKLSELSDQELEEEIKSFKYPIFFILGIIFVFAVIGIVPPIFTGEPFPEMLSVFALMIGVANVMMLSYSMTKIEKRIREAVKNGA